MDTQALLEKLLAGGRELAGQVAEQGKDVAQKGLDLAQKGLGVPEGEGAEKDAMISGLGKGAIAGGLLALLIGTKTGRKIASPAVKLGSLAALGGLGYMAYKKYQESQGITVDEGGSIAALEGPKVQERSLGIIKAMVGAAKADGHIDAAEQAAILEQIKHANLGEQATEILMAEVQAPLDVAAVAAHATSPEAAVEMYLASLVVVDSGNEQEKNYLKRLADAMNLSDDLVNQIESTAFAPA